MKHFALFGLILGLFAAARLGAATPATGPLLFEVLADLNSGTIKITPQNALPRNLDVNVPPYTVNDGITLLNFFPNSGSITQPSGGASLSSLTPSGSLNVYENPSGLTVQFTHYEIFSANTFVRTSPASLDEANPNNPGKSLGLNALGNYGLELIGGENESAFKFYQDSSTPTLTLSFPALMAMSETQFRSGGPYYVYAAQNTSAVQQDEQINSFLGTYTLNVVPEPSTYAAIAGGLGLAAAVIHRRRQRAKAAQA
jgi:hypothetical protein